MTYLEDYLEAVGVNAGPPTRELLDALVRGHIATFPFSSAGVRLGDQLPLGLDAVYERIVVRRRGGYCFEQNLLVFEMLTQLGFNPRMYLGRVLTSGNPHPPLTHRVSVVALDGIDHLVDVGFGPHGPSAAVPFDGAPVGAPWRRVRLTRLGAAEWLTRAGPDDNTQDLYRFEFAQYGASDCEVGHFYSHRHPDAHFVTTLVASRILDDEIRSLRNRDYWILRPDGSTSTRVVDADDLRRILVTGMNLRLSPNECDRLFAGIADT